MHDKQVLEIIFVLKSSNDSFFLICLMYETVKFDHTMNAFEIQKLLPSVESIFLIDVKDLVIEETFDQKIAGSSTFIIAENLEILRALQD